MQGSELVPRASKRNALISVQRDLCQASDHQNCEIIHSYWLATGFVVIWQSSDRKLIHGLMMSCPNKGKIIDRKALSSKVIAPFDLQHEINEFQGGGSLP